MLTMCLNIFQMFPYFPSSQQLQNERLRHFQMNGGGGPQPSFEETIQRVSPSSQGKKRKCGEKRYFLAPTDRPTGRRRGREALFDHRGGGQKFVMCINIFHPGTGSEPISLLRSEEKLWQGRRTKKLEVAAAPPVGFEVLPE